MPAKPSKPSKLKITHIPLHCPICGNRFMNIFGQPLPNHSQIRCTTSKGDQMDLGICSDCVNNGVSMELCNAVLEGIKDHWTLEINLNKNMKQEEKKHKIDFHKSHVVADVTKIVNTGKRAEKQARKMGKLE